ncbi:unnamed protein product [Larinioides sclopetarius]|uniref:Uncharacterized protein n=1 Tax=Larinioides sclopetarius TaxID=280406 RepID=A0AAV2AG46_9ARAC
MPMRNLLNVKCVRENLLVNIVYVYIYVNTQKRKFTNIIKNILTIVIF